MEPSVAQRKAQSLAFYDKLDRELLTQKSKYSETHRNLDDLHRATHVIIDCDPGGDDAQALILAFHLAKQYQIDILGLTCVAGNGTLDDVLAAAQMTVEVCGQNDIGIYKGLDPFGKG